MIRPGVHTIHSTVKAKNGREGWVVSATFVNVEAQGRCIDYRVRALPDIEDPDERQAVIEEIAAELRWDAERP